MHCVVQRGKQRPLNQVDLEDGHVQQLCHHKINARLVRLIYAFVGKAKRDYNYPISKSIG